MTTVSNQARLIARDENLDVRQKKVAFDGKTKNLKGVGKNGKEGISTRKPLGDLTNKRNIHAEITTKKPTAQHNKPEECFLHDHSKCIHAKNADLKLPILDLILPKYDAIFSQKKDSALEKEESDSSLKPDKMEIPDMLHWESPSPLYKRSDSPASTFAWKFEPVEFVLKDEKTINKKGSVMKETEGVRGRKALGDVTNKKDIHVEVSAKKQQNEFNIAEECFLHDHSKCIEANNAALKISLLDLILPKCDTVFTKSQDSARPMEDVVSCLVPDEMEIPDLSQWDTPPPFYNHTPPASPFAWKFQPVQFTLNDEY